MSGCFTAQRNRIDGKRKPLTSTQHQRPPRGVEQVPRTKAGGGTLRGQGGRRATNHVTDNDDSFLEAFCVAEPHQYATKFELISRLALTASIQVGSELLVAAAAKEKGHGFLIANIIWRR